MYPTLKDAIVAGIVASFAYTIVAQPIVVALYGLDNFFVPFRQIAAVAVGPGALSPAYNVLTATLLGTGVHFAVGIIYAVVFWSIVRNALITSRPQLMVVGAVYGIVIYALNLFVIFPRWFPWFLENDPLLQATLHALPFGMIIGWWLSRSTEAETARYA